MLGNLIGGFIVIIVGVSLMPSLADQIYVATHNVSGGGSNNVTGTPLTIINLVPLFYALGIMSAGVALTVGGLKSAGIM